jgi:hypothetical protein
VNTGTTAVSLAELTLRYWYTIDGSAAQDWMCWYSQIGCSNVSASFTTVSRVGADRYIELSFASGAGSIDAGGNVRVEYGFHKDWTNYTQTNDYSFDATKTSYADWTKVTLYRNGVLVWGVEP